MISDNLRWMWSPGFSFWWSGPMLSRGRVASDYDGVFVAEEEVVQVAAVLEAGF